MERLLNRRVVLAQCPQGPIQRQHFDLVTAEIDEVPDGHVVLRVILAQIAPAARGRDDHHHHHHRFRPNQGR